MKSPYFLLSYLLSVFFCTNLCAKEYGGKWDDESIRECSMEYIENTKKQFEKRALQLSEVNGSPFVIQYRQLTPQQQEYYEKFLKDRINEKDRKLILGLILNDLESVRAKLAEAEKAAYDVWEKLPKEKKEQKTIVATGELYGTSITSSYFGVLLDNSPSMEPYLDAVRAEIKKTFPDAQIREAAESGLHINYSLPTNGTNEFYDDAWYYGIMPANGVNPFDPKWHQPEIFSQIEPHYRQVGIERNALPALMALIKLQEVDTLYWFCDFEDDLDPKALKKLEEAILKHRVKLYVHSSNQRPKKELVELIEKSGGEVIRKRIK